jgi:polysaccharide deacetylase 2 family uncharacterized protein YibQ
LARLSAALARRFRRAGQRLSQLSGRSLRLIALVAAIVVAGGAGYLLALRSDHPSASIAPAPVVQKTPVPATRPPPAALPAPQPQQARLPTPPAPDRGQPAWLRYAVASPPLEPGKKLIAVVIDDMGLDRPRSMRVVDLPGPLTLSYLPYAKELATQTALARLRGHELMMHIPMEPMGSADPGPNALRTGMSDSELRQRLTEDLSQFDGFVGINNHMGSRFTATRASMAVVLGELKKRGLLFLDSRTTAQTVGATLAGEMGVPTVSRNVFLDDDMSSQNVVHQLAELERIARKQGYAVAIGHPHDNTVAALARWLPHLRQQGFILVPLSTIVRQRGAG